MDVQVNDILVMKKEHPCGAKQWLVLRSGMDFRLRCTGCAARRKKASARFCAAGSQSDNTRKT